MVEKNGPKNEGKETEGPAESLSKEAIAKMYPATQALVKQLLEENAVTKNEAREARRIVKELKDRQVLKGLREHRCRSDLLEHPPTPYSHQRCADADDLQGTPAIQPIWLRLLFL